MKNAVGIFAAALSLTFGGHAAAASFAFSFSDDGIGNIQGRERVPGTVTGILHGLADSGASLPTAITITSTPAGFGMDYLHSDIMDLWYGPGFTVENGEITFANLGVNVFDENWVDFQLRFNVYEEGVNTLFWNGGQGPVLYGVGNQGGFSGVTYSLISGPVPEPGTWLLLIAGFGLVGTAVRRRGAHSALSRVRV